MRTQFDMVVIGAGHAGCEAASAAARLGRSVLCITLRADGVARLSCNPAIGGLAKGHLVRELDALGGLMGRVADASCIQFRMLNTRKGFAVQSSRAQVDIHRYPAVMQGLLKATPGLQIIEGEVAQLIVHGGRIAGVRLADDAVIDTTIVILTSGTFLGGLLHRGETSEVGGRVGDGAAHALSTSMSDLGLRLGRLKTGTPPRLDGRTIDWHKVSVQQDTAPERRFSFCAERSPRLRQVDCHLTFTNEQTHDLVRSGLDRSPLFSGAIEGTGPRYCPSIEDKVARFAERERHLIFLEPEGLDTHRVYPNGISTSLPADLQGPMMRTIVGLERVEILQLGYAVEYNYADPVDLGPDLQHRSVPGLYLAGQVNGTSGYEEAAVQGFVAGVSAAIGEPFVLERDQAYMGVLVDDLTSRGVGGEPYRMFTSRAEHRLLLREDNADRRLMPRGRELGLVDDATWALFEHKLEAIERGLAAASDTMLKTDPATQDRLVASGVGTIRRPSSVRELIRRPSVGWHALAQVVDLPKLSSDAAEQVEIDIKYEGYVERAQRRAKGARKLEHLNIPRDLVWEAQQALSWEVRERLARAAPTTIGQASRVPGVTPAAINVLVAIIAKQRASV